MKAAIIDDEEMACRHIKRVLDAEGFEVEYFLDGHSFLQRLGQQTFPIVFIDLHLPDIHGMEILTQVKSRFEDTEAIIITGNASIETAVDAIKAGAFHYITKPFKRHDIRLLANTARKKIELLEENRALRQALSNGGTISGFVGSSPAMQEVFAMINKVAMVNCNVLLQAETGTGKQMAARSIHSLSPRKENAFIAFNCGGFAEELIASELFGHEKGAFTGATATKIGLLETASEGTVFLDEIGEMPLSMQVKLLHVLQERQIFRVGGTKAIDLDIRIIAATNKDLKKEVEAGSFREDLFYRLNVVTIRLPKLTERKDDIPLLISHFIEKFGLAFSKDIRQISPQTLDILLHYHYPGNVRELENIIQRAVALAEGESIQVRDLPADLRKLAFTTFEGEDLLSLETMEKQHISKVLDITGNNRKLSSEILGIPLTTLWRRLKKYGLSKK
ncbi:MAG: sigma-54 dependent transcriptional regulator [Proteobacteria bacterium]|nr:sigma-54 dependent transcriptional regulator [Pseudomonadota bacterium]MBU4294324.1 sigma-54 dependent transcriptional regulator [Pseudomonadota bacterium]MCG2749111.1 sigma-54 dependent transcriptional regulator [Desulfobulbaceae bacterium]